MDVSSIMHNQMFQFYGKEYTDLCIVYKVQYAYHLFQLLDFNRCLWQHLIHKLCMYIYVCMFKGVAFNTLA